MKLLILISLVMYIILSTNVPRSSSAKILSVTFFSSKSHKITYMPLLQELAKRGHEITMITPVKSDKKIPNITEIFTFDLEEKMSEFKKDHDMYEMKEKGKMMNPFLMLDAFGNICRWSYQLPQIKEFLSKNHKYDLAFVQPMFNDCIYGLVHKLNLPMVLFSPASVPQMLVSKIGGDFPASFIGNVFLDFPNEMTFSQRFVNFGANIALELLLRYYYEPFMANIYREELGDPTIPGVSEIIGERASLLLSNGHFALSGGKPYLPDVIDVGGIHSRPAKPLPKDLEEFASKSGKDGFIYFSLGSALKGSEMPEAKRKLFVNVFSKLKQKVIWKWETETMPDLPKNVKLGKWLPQQDILGHPNIKMFISHCGGGGTEEAIYHGVPILGLPMFGDQLMNAKKAKNSGYLVELDWNNLTEDELMKAINEILNTPKYFDNVKQLSKVFKDQPDNPLERGVFWIEYVLRHNGAPHLKSASRKLNYFQYHSYDVIAAYIGIISTIVYIVFALLRFIFRCCCCRSTKGRVTESKSKKFN